MFEPFFSHIYIEAGAEQLPLTKTCLDQFPRATLVEINNYKELFNRPRQDWQLQSKSRKLILASKPDNFLYPNSELVSSYSFTNSFYSSQILNCLYNCSYCYLQGLYNSANIVVFANTQDYLEHAQNVCKQLSPMYLCISYDTDLLAFEKLFGLNRIWINFAKSNPDILIETRTKSANFTLIADLVPADNFILAWTISPEIIQANKEALTASLKKRLQAAQQAILAGWKVRICIDPIIYFDNWQHAYRELIETMASILSLPQVRDFSLGSFRINQDFLTKMRRHGRSDAVIYYPYETNQQTASYAIPLAEELTNFVKNCLIEHGINPERCVTI